MIPCLSNTNAEKGKEEMGIPGHVRLYTEKPCLKNLNWKKERKKERLRLPFEICKSLLNKHRVCFVAEEKEDSKRGRKHRHTSSIPAGLGPAEKLVILGGEHEC